MKDSYGREMCMYCHGYFDLNVEAKPRHLCEGMIKEMERQILELKKELTK